MSSTRQSTSRVDIVFEISVYSKSRIVELKALGELGLQESESVFQQHEQILFRILVESADRFWKHKLGIVRVWEAAQWMELRVVMKEAVGSVVTKCRDVEQRIATSMHDLVPTS